MSYTIMDKEGYCLAIRLIADRQPDNATWFTFQVYNPMPQGTEWLCDPCAPSAKRYCITFPDGREQYARWFEVVVADDTPADVDLKLAHMAAVKRARIAAEAAHQEWLRLNG